MEPVLFAAAGPADRAAQRAAEAPFAAAFAAGRLQDAARAFLAQWGDGAPWEALPPTQRARIAARMPLIAAAEPALWEDAEGLLAPGRLEALDRPALLIDGGASPPVMAAICDALAARLPGARRAHVAGAGHMLPVTHPGPTADALRALWARS
jgi:pimeloyl-ACP methyl ester carboxylesterase